MDIVETLRENADLDAAERDRCAAECERKYPNGNYAHDTRGDCSEAIRRMK